MNVRTLLREPLLHFLLLGLALFVLFGAVSKGGGDSHKVVITQPQVDEMARQYQSLWGGPPGPAELRGMVDSAVREEILYREGMAMGLGRDDEVIKRRVRQKLEVISEEENNRAPPSDADLTAYLQTHPARFARPPVVSFDQVYFDPAQLAADGGKRLALAQAALAKGQDPAGLGQQSLLPRNVERTALTLVARDFGEGFAQALASLPVGVWQGPVTSGLGTHLVRISARTPGMSPPLADVRAEVTREWENDRRQRALEASYRKLRRDYDVVIEAKLPPARP